MTMLAEPPSLRFMTDQQLAGALGAGGDFGAIAAECDRRDRAARARARQRERQAGWHDAAYANYLAAEEYTRGNLLSPAGKRAGRDPWPMLWQGGEEHARKLASEDLLHFWDWQAARPPGPADYAAGMRESEAENAPPVAADLPRVSAADLARMAARGEAPEPAEPGAIARYITALSALAGHTERVNARIACTSSTHSD